MKFKVLDDAGAVHDVDTTSNVGAAILLMEYARARGFRLGPYLQVGDVVVQVVDTRQETSRRVDEPVDEDFARVMNPGDD
jgi:hypothetical protein